MGKCLLNVGSFAMRLKGPCSTSTSRSVALNFASSDGLILELNNDGFGAQEQRFFDCSIISNFFEESERLWIAGEEALRIQSIVIVSTARDYRKLLRGLYVFDAMISGVRVIRGDIKGMAADSKLIGNLMEWKLCDGDFRTTAFDSYLIDGWDLFLQNKKEVLFNLDVIERSFQSLSNLMLFGVVNNENSTANGNDNMFRHESLLIFSSLERVKIRTSGSRYKLRLESLAESIEWMSPSITVMVEDDGRWAQDALTDDIFSSFEMVGWSVVYKENVNALVIKSAV